MNLKGLTAIVTGSSGQLGRELATALAQAGCNCICQYRDNEQTAQDVAGKIHQLGQKAIALGARLDSDESIADLFMRIDQWCRSQSVEMPRILVNSAAVFEKQPLDAITFASARAITDINLIAGLVMSRYFVKQLRKQNESQAISGKIINITDSGALRPWANYSVYCASKAGLVAATQSLAKELAPSITVNAIAPGVTTWPAGYDQSQKSRQEQFIPLKRIGATEEIASAMLFLLTNDYVTGQVLSVDGGRTL